MPSSSECFWISCTWGTYSKRRLQCTSNDQCRALVDFPPTGWAQLLAVSDTLACEDIKAYAIRQIDAEFPGIDAATRLLLARNHDVKGWLKPAYLELVKREQRFSLEHATAFGIEITAKLYEARERYRDLQRPPLPSSETPIEWPSTWKPTAFPVLSAQDRACEEMVVELFWLPIVSSPEESPLPAQPREVVDELESHELDVLASASEVAASSLKKDKKKMKMMKKMEGRVATVNEPIEWPLEEPTA